MITEILQMVTEGGSVREIADKLGLSTESVLSRLQTMERMGLLSTDEDRSGPGCGPPKCRSCCGCGGASPGSSVKQYRLTEKGRMAVKKGV
jgi:predicted ArsR family transcriptional regulator